MTGTAIHRGAKLPPSASWLLLAVGAIGLSALFAVLLVVSRTPFLQQLFGLESMFHTALVLHVDFSVLIWLLTGLGCLWARERTDHLPFVQRSAFGLSAAGAILLSLSPMFNSPAPVMSNYIPVLQSPLFFTALLSFACGMTLAALRLLLPGRGRSTIPARISAVAFLCAMAAFLLSALRLPQIASTASLEQLFWGGGHLLQFVYLLLLQHIWFETSGSHSGRRSLWLLALLPSLLGLGMALVLDPQQSASRHAFTELMRFGTPLVCLPAIGWLLTRPRLPALVSASVGLLTFGMLLGVLIRSDNVMVTAHYHATNAAVTLALMGMLYQLLPRLGLGGVSSRAVRFQLPLYSIGMLLYICGMAWSGWLDIPRKTPMLHQQGMELFSMGLMGIGGLVAVTATGLFFLLLLGALRQTQGATNTPFLPEGR